MYFGRAMAFDILLFWLLKSFSIDVCDNLIPLYKLYDQFSQY